MEELDAEKRGKDGYSAFQRQRSRIHSTSYGKENQEQEQPSA